MQNDLMTVQLKRLRPGAITPTYGSAEAAGADLYACLDGAILVPSGGRALIPTGWAMQVPPGYEVQIRSRSGLALTKTGMYVAGPGVMVGQGWGVTVGNSPGTVDSDYRGEVCVIVYNGTLGSFQVLPGDRLAQMLVKPVQQVQFAVVAQLDETGRGTGAYGSTGVALAPTA